MNNALSATQNLLLGRIAKERDGLPVARVPMAQRNDLHALVDSGHIKVVKVERNGRETMRLVLVKKA